MAAMLISAQAVDYDGAVLSGAKLNVYDAGTTTPRAIYASKELASGASSANPAVATATGGIAVWVDDSAGDIKVTLTNSAGTTTYYSQDNIDPTNGNLVVFPLGGSDQTTGTGDSVAFANLTVGAVAFSGVTADPGSDRIMFWDDSDTQVEWLTLDTGLSIATNTLSLDAQLVDIAGLTPTDGNIIVGDGTNFVTESGATARTSLGLGAGNSPDFAGISLGGGTTYTAILDEDAMGSDSATSLASQQSIKAYVDNMADTVADINAITQADGTFIVSDGTNWIGETGATLRTSIGLNALPDTEFKVADNADATKLGAFQLSGVTTGNTRTLTWPDFDGTIATLAGAETLTNKTLTSPVLNTGVSGTAFLDEDDMVSDSATKLASQQSIKAYFDNATVADYTAAKALLAGIYSSIWIEDANRGGMFVWRSGNQSSSITGDSGEGIWVPPSSDVTGASGAWQRLYEGGVSPNWFGCAGDGSTDDTTAFYLAVDYARDNGLDLRGRAGSTYYIPNSNATKELTTAGRYGWGDIKIKASTSLGSNEMLDIYPVASSDPSVVSATPNADAYRGATTITITADPSSDFAAGDTVILIDDRLYSDEGGANEPRVSEWLVISSITGGGPYTVTFTQPLKSSYTTAQNFRMWRADDSIEIDWHGVSIVGPGSGSQAVGVRFLNVSDVHLHNCDATGFYHTSWEFQYCARPRIHHLWASESYLSGQGYGLVMGGCFAPQVDTVYGNRTRHLITLGDSISTTNIMGQGGIFQNIVGVQCLGAVVDSHTGWRDPVFVNVDGEGDDAGSAQEGIVLESAGGKVINANIRGFNNASGTAILLKTSGKPKEEGAATYVLRDIKTDNFTASGLTGVNIRNDDELYNNDMRLFVDGMNMSAAQAVSFRAEFGNIFVTIENAYLRSSSNSGIYAYQNYKYHNIEVDLYGVDIDTRGSSTSNYAIYAWANKYTRDPGEALTLSASTGTHQTATVASAGTFSQFDVGSTIEEKTSGSGVGTIVAVDSDGDVAYIDITANFSGTSISSANWSLVEPSVNSKVRWHTGRSIKNEANIVDTAVTVSGTGTGTITITGVAGDFHPEYDLNRRVTEVGGTGVATVTSVSDDGSVATVNATTGWSSTTPGAFTTKLTDLADHFRTINGEIILGASVEIIGGDAFKAQSGEGNTYRHAAASVATS